MSSSELDLVVETIGRAFPFSLDTWSLERQQPCWIPVFPSGMLPARRRSRLEKP